MQRTQPESKVRLTIREVAIVAEGVIIPPQGKVALSKGTSPIAAAFCAAALFQCVYRGRQVLDGGLEVSALERLSAAQNLPLSLEPGCVVVGCDYGRDGEQDEEAKSKSQHSTLPHTAPLISYFVQRRRVGSW
jgi:hypothetical protein